MTDASQRVSLLIDLAPLIDGDAETEARHQGLLSDNPAAHQLAQDAFLLAERVGEVGSDFRPGATFESRLVRALALAERRRHSEPPDPRRFRHSQSAPFPPERKSATRPVRRTLELPDLSSPLEQEAQTASDAPTAPLSRAHLATSFEYQSNIPDPRRVAKQTTPSTRQPAASAEPAQPERRKRVSAMRLLALSLLAGLSAMVGTLYWAPPAPPEQTFRQLRIQGGQWLRKLQPWSLRDPSSRPSPPNPFRAMTLRTLPATTDSLGGQARSQGLKYPPGLTLTDDSISTPLLLIAELDGPQQRLVLGRRSRLELSGSDRAHWCLTGALLLHRQPDAAPLTITTEHANVHLRGGVVAMRSDPSQTLVAVLSGSAEIEPKQDIPLRAIAGNLLRIPVRGQPQHLAQADPSALLAEFVALPADGRLGRLLPLRYDGEHPPVHDFPLLPKRHAVRVQLSSHHALVEVTETFVVRPGGAPLRYQRPLPPGAQAVPATALSAEPSPYPPSSIRTRVSELGHPFAATVEPVLEQAPVPCDAPILEISSRHLMPLTRIGDEHVLEYAVSGPADNEYGQSPALGLSPVEFSAEVTLNGGGRLRSDAPFAVASRDGRGLSAKTAVGAEGLVLRVSATDKQGDGSVRYAAASTAASNGPQPARRDELIGTLNYRAPRAARELKAQHWILVVDDSYDMHGAPRELVAPLLAQLSAALPAEDRISLLHCALDCQAVARALAGEDADELARLPRLKSAMQARGSFNVGHALLEAQALHRAQRVPGNGHIVLLSRLFGSAGALDPRPFLSLEGGLDPGSPGPAATDRGQAEVSFVRLGQADATGAPGPILSGRYLSADSTLQARAAALTLLRYQQYEPLRDAHLSLTRGGKVVETLALGNRGGDAEYQAQLPMQRGLLDGAVLTGSLAGQPFERRYVLPPPPPLLDVTAESIAAALAAPIASTAVASAPQPPGEEAVAAYDSALAKGLRRKRPARSPLTLLDLTRGPVVPLPWATTAPAPTEADAQPATCPPAAPERCAAALSHWGNATTVNSDDAPGLLLRLGRRDEALDAAIRVAALHPDDHTLQRQAAAAYLLKDEPAWACPHLHRAAELSGDRAAFEEALECWSGQPSPEAQLSQRLLQEQLAALRPAVARKRTRAPLELSAEWAGADDYDVGLVDHNGAVHGLLDGSTSRDSALSAGGERLQLPHLEPGVYTVELWHRTPRDRPASSEEGESESDPAAGQTVRVTVRAGSQRLQVRAQPAASRTEVARLIVRKPL